MPGYYFGPITWRFETRVDDQWITHRPPGHPDLDDGTNPAGLNHLIDQSQEVSDFARIELDDTLVDILEELDPVPVAALRILVWAADVDEIGTTSSSSTGPDPDVVLQATARQLAQGRLEVAARQVRRALDLVENARATLREQMIASAAEDGLGRNHIARTASGAWSRRLVLAYLAGHDLRLNVQQALPPEWPRSRVFDRGWDLPATAYDHERGVERVHIGPYLCGHVQLDLQTDGAVWISVTGIHPPEDTALYRPRTGETDQQRARREERLAEHDHAAAALAREVAERALPLLQQRRFVVAHPDGTSATADDLAHASVYPENHLVITRPSS